MGKKCFLVILNYILIFFVFLICENGKKKLGHQVFLFCFVFLYETGWKKSFDRIFVFIFNFWVRLSKTSLGFTPEIKNWPKIFFSYFYTLKQITKKFSKFFNVFFLSFFCVKLRKKTSTFHT